MTTQTIDPQRTAIVDPPTEEAKSIEIPEVFLRAFSATGQAEVGNGHVLDRRRVKALHRIVVDDFKEELSAHGITIPKLRISFAQKFAHAVLIAKAFAQTADQTIETVSEQLVAKVMGAVHFVVQCLVVAATIPGIVWEVTCGGHIQRRRTRQVARILSSR